MTLQQLSKKTNGAKSGDVIITTANGVYTYPSQDIITWYHSKYRKVINDVCTGIFLIYTSNTGKEEICIKELYSKNFKILKGLTMVDYKADYRQNQINSILED